MRYLFVLMVVSFLLKLLKTTAEDFHLSAITWQNYEITNIDLHIQPHVAFTESFLIKYLIESSKCSCELKYQKHLRANIKNLACFLQKRFCRATVQLQKMSCFLGYTHWPLVFRSTCQLWIHKSCLTQNRSSLKQNSASAKKDIRLIDQMTQFFYCFFVCKFKKNFTVHGSLIFVFVCNVSLIYGSVFFQVNHPTQGHEVTA